MKRLKLIALVILGSVALTACEEDIEPSWEGEYALTCNDLSVSYKASFGSVEVKTVNEQGEKGLFLENSAYDEIEINEVLSCDGNGDFSSTSDIADFIRQTCLSFLPGEEPDLPSSTIGEACAELADSIQNGFKDALTTFIVDQPQSFQIDAWTNEEYDKNNRYRLKNLVKFPSEDEMFYPGLWSDKDTGEFDHSIPLVAIIPFPLLTPCYIGASHGVEGQIDMTSETMAADFRTALSGGCAIPVNERLYGFINGIKIEYAATGINQ